RLLYASVWEAIDACLKAGPDVAIEAVAISNQRESVTAWDAETGEALGPVVSWQFRRTAQDFERLITEGHLHRVQARER
ncbi:FGGY family carbohydrate kinase, partial [Rhizobium ruizarguesonis]